MCYQIPWVSKSRLNSWISFWIKTFCKFWNRCDFSKDFLKTFLIWISLFPQSTYAKDLDNIFRGRSHANIRAMSLTNDRHICPAIWTWKTANIADATDRRRHSNEKIHKNRRTRTILSSSFVDIAAFIF